MLVRFGYGSAPKPRAHFIIVHVLPTVSPICKNLNMMAQRFIPPQLTNTMFDQNPTTRDHLVITHILP
jgi:hypothetical protein